MQIKKYTLNLTPIPVRNAEADCVNETDNMEDLWDAATIGLSAEEIIAVTEKRESFLA